MRDDTLDQRLRDAAASGDSRALDRTCESIAQQLVREGSEPTWQIQSGDFSQDGRLISADRYWRLRFLDEPTVRTAAACARWLKEHTRIEHRDEIEQKWSLGYAFITRHNVETQIDLGRGNEVILTEHDGDPDVFYFTALYHAGKLRANFWFDELHSFLESSLLAIGAGSRRAEPIYVALRSFAAFGSRDLSLERATRLLEGAWGHPDRTRHVMDVCLNGLWAAAPFDGQGEMLHARAAEAVAGHPADHIFRFRLATGERMTSRHESGLEHIDAALRLLPAIGERISHKELQELYRRERDLILEGWHRAEQAAEQSQWASEQEKRWQQQLAENQELRQALQASTARVIGLAGLLTAVVGLTVSAAELSLAGKMSLADRLWTLSTLGGWLTIFALLMITGAWWITKGGSGRS